MPMTLPELLAESRPFSVISERERSMIRVAILKKRFGITETPAELLTEATALFQGFSESQLMQIEVSLLYRYLGP